MNRRPAPVLARMLRAPSKLYDWRAGWLLRSRFCRLTHEGRTSGRENRTVLEVVAEHPPSGQVAVMSGFGRGADWYRNVHANGIATIEIGRRRFRAAVFDLGTDDAAAVLAGYERRNRLLAPVVRRVLSQLVGWRYEGTDASRRRLVQTLPIVVFTPTRPPS